MAKFSVRGFVRFMVNGGISVENKDADAEKNIYYLHAMYPTVERRVEAQKRMLAGTKQPA